MARKNAHPGAKERIAQRRRAAFEYAVRGASFRDIGTALGVSHVTAFRDVQTVTQSIIAETALSAEERIVIHEEQLHIVQRNAITLVQDSTQKTGDRLKAMDRVIRANESERRLFGTDAKYNNHDWWLKLIDPNKLSDRQVELLTSGEDPIKVLLGKYMRDDVETLEALDDAPKSPMLPSSRDEDEAEEDDAS